MIGSKSNINVPKSKDFLFLQLRDLPYFRAFLRAVESSYYQDLPLPAPVYDVGCGDGHFASLTFEQKIDVGLDPWHGPIHEAQKHGAYRSLVEADGAYSPFPGQLLCQRVQQFGAGAYPAHRRGAGRDGSRVETGRAVLFLCAEPPLSFRAFDIPPARAAGTPNGSAGFRAFLMPMNPMSGRPALQARVSSLYAGGITFRPSRCAC